MFVRQSEAKTLVCQSEATLIRQSEAKTLVRQSEAKTLSSPAKLLSCPPERSEGQKLPILIHTLYQRFFLFSRPSFNFFLSCNSPIDISKMLIKNQKIAFILACKGRFINSLNVLVKSSG